MHSLQPGWSTPAAKLVRGELTARDRHFVIGSHRIPTFLANRYARRS